MDVAECFSSACVLCFVEKMCTKQIVIEIVIMGNGICFCFPHFWHCLRSSAPSKSLNKWHCRKCNFVNNSQNTICGGIHGLLGCKTPRPKGQLQAKSEWFCVTTECNCASTNVKTIHSTSWDLRLIRGVVIYFCFWKIAKRGGEWLPSGATRGCYPLGMLELSYCVERIV